jgi:hypothetical protein
MHPRLRTAAAMLATLGGLAPAVAGTASGTLGVNINLKPPPGAVGTGLCISSTLSAQTNALVQVVCASNQFVSIEARPGRPFVGTHGGAHRFVFSPGTVIPFDLLYRSDISDISSGTITALRVFNLQRYKDRLELMVSF